ncbi:uncharacterized protein K02A2.6-like [Paramuricea clavata]|uniref:Uncharacterized protein K02A2.6-like n=1 Tax=Paramuricea clavata TaxID=317549 RepID=A0A7D9HDW4_PARCT|nr:uncharacterized protein K02A2.6-like [Paramuricea clavata]
MKNNWAKVSMTRPYHGIRHELTVIDDIILRGSPFLMPTSLRERTLKQVHEGHQGIVKTKRLLREKVWWPGIDQAIEQLIRTCIACQAQGPVSAPPPLHMTTMPSQPWQTLHANLCGPFPSGESLLVMVDTCSRWPEVHVMKSTTSTAIIKCMKTTFATHGIPHEIVTDNGPQFTFAEFSTYLSNCGIVHCKVTPYWPQANSEVERFNRTVEKAIRAANVEGKNWKEEFDVFADDIPVTVRQHDRERREKIKSYADDHKRASLSEGEKEDAMLLRQPRQTKLSTTYDPKPYIVEEKKGPSVLLKRPFERPIMRNESMIDT